MEKLWDLFESIAERFKNPLLFTFAISWAIVNFKFIVVLLSDGSYQDKFAYIENTLYSSGPDAHLFKLIYLPLLSAVVYVFVFPAISLLTTWATSAYENTHNKVRAYTFRKATLTIEQRDTLLRNTTDVVNKLQREVQDAKTARLDTMNRTAEHVELLFKEMQTCVFRQLTLDSQKWPSDYPKPPQDTVVDRTISGTPEQEQFVTQYGIPFKWAELFRKATGDDRLTKEDVARYLDITQDEAQKILLGLSALGMLQFRWIDDSPHFQFINSSWVALLNGRPA